MPPLKKEADDQFEAASLESISLKQLHDAIPARLFERSTLKSTIYLIYNLSLVLLTFGLTYYWINNLCPDLLFWPTVVTYWLVQGTITTGIWVIAHECGHQAYSSSQFINDTVGLILHSSLLTPYHAWKISHGLHHRSTGHMDRDMVFVPPTERQYYQRKESVLSVLGHGLRVLTGNGVTKTEEEKSCVPESHETSEYWTDIPILAFLAHSVHITLMLVLGWPLYLILNKTGQQYEGRWAHHFSSKTPIFNGKYEKEILISNLGLLATLATLVYVGYHSSFSAVAVYYLGPYLVVNAWLVLITFLHHTDPRLPHYRDGAWTYVKGALSTIDRDYGWIINHLHHHIADTHIVHHLFSKIPHYNAVEVTRIIKPILGPHYNFDRTFFLKSLWYSFTKCQYVPDEGEVVYYKS